MHRHYILLSDIPNEPLDIWTSHLFEQPHILLHLVDMPVIMPTGLIVNDYSLPSISNHPVGPFGRGFPILILHENGIFVDDPPMRIEPDSRLWILECLSHQSLDILAMEGVGKQSFKIEFSHHFFHILRRLDF